MRLGISMSKGALTAVAVDGKKPIWAGSYSFDDDADLSAAMSELSNELPRHPSAVGLAVESDLCQVRVLNDVPPVKSKDLGRLISTQSPRWFLKNGDPLIAVASRSRSGQVFAAAIGSKFLASVTGAVVTAGLGVPRVSPATHVVGTAVDDGEWVRTVGAFFETVEVSEASVLSIRRGPQNGARQFVPRDFEGFGAGGDGEGAAIAWAVAIQRSDLVFESPDDRALRDKVHRRRIVAAIVVAVGLWLGAIALYGIRLNNVRDDATNRLTELQPEISEVLRLQSDVDRADQALDTMADAIAARSDDVVLLGLLTESLSDSVHLVSIRRSGANVTVAGVAPSAAAVVALLERFPRFELPKLVGPVTREVTATGVLERFGLTFLWRSDHD